MWLMITISHAAYTCTKLLLLGAAQLLVLVVDIEIPGELLVILDPVSRLLALCPVPGVALHSAVDDVDCGAKTRADSIGTVLIKLILKLKENILHAILAIPVHLEPRCHL